MILKRRWSDRDAHTLHDSFADPCHGNRTSTRRLVSRYAEARAGKILIYATEDRQSRWGRCQRARSLQPFVPLQGSADPVATVPGQMALRHDRHAVCMLR